MYRISTHERYALRMMADIAEQTSNHPHAAGQTNNSEEQVKMPTLPDISKQQEIPQTFPSPEARHLRRGNHYLLPGSGVPTFTCGTSAHFEASEAQEGDSVAVLQRFGDGRNEGIESGAGLLLGQFCLGSDRLDQFGFVHFFFSLLLSRVLIPE